MNAIYNWVMTEHDYYHQNKAIAAQFILFVNEY